MQVLCNLVDDNRLVSLLSSSSTASNTGAASIGSVKNSSSTSAFSPPPHRIKQASVDLENAAADTFPAPTLLMAHAPDINSTMPIQGDGELSNPHVDESSFVSTNTLGDISADTVISSGDISTGSGSVAEVTVGAVVPTTEELMKLLD